MKATVDTDTCTGCTLCTMTCPDVFRMDGEKAAVFVDVVSRQAEDTCQRAVEECPVGAITTE